MTAESIVFGSLAVDLNVSTSRRVGYSIVTLRR